MLTIRSSSFLLQEAMLMHQRGAIGEAAARYTQVLSGDPKNVDALCLLGMAMGQQGRFAEAAAHLRKTVKLSPRHAAAHNLLGVALRELGKPEDALKSFERALACQADFREPCVNAANLLMALGRPADAADAYGRLLAVRPDLADLWCDRGVALEAMGRREEALDNYDRALALKPNLAEAHANRGNVLAALERRDEAVASYDRAIAARSDFFEVHINRGNVLRLLGRPHEALAGYDRAITLDAGHADPHFSRGLALEDLARFDAAIASYDRALALRPDGDPSFAGRVHAHRASALDQLGRFDEAFADADRSLQLAPDDHGIRYRLCFLDLLHGRWGEAWPRHESRIPLGYGIPAGFVPPPSPQWTGEPPGDEILVLRCEQGAGDRIQFCCFVPHLAERGYRIALWTNRLTELLQTVRGVEKVGAEFADLAGQGRARWLHLMSLPLVLGTTPETVPRTAPYLAADAARVVTWKERLGTRGFRIGIAWQGNPTYRQDKLRSIPLAAFAPLAEIPGVRLIALQKGYGSEQIGQVPFGDRIESLGDDFDSGPAFLDTAAVMMNLDLVISPNTAITHLAGALGRPVFVALNQFPDWRWLLGRDDSPWYPSARLFRQTAAGDWDGVFGRIATAVGDMAQHR